MATGPTEARTLADLMAAARIGAIDPDTAVVTTAEHSAALDQAREDAYILGRSSAPATATASTAGYTGTATALSPTDHECGIAGCRHGSAHGPSQPDRQVKLACPACGAVARMTASALQVSGGIRCVGGVNRTHEGTDYAPAARRTYNRKAS